MFFVVCVKVCLLTAAWQNCGMLSVYIPLLLIKNYIYQMHAHLHAHYMLICMRIYSMHAHVHAHVHAHYMHICTLMSMLICRMHIKACK